MRHVIGQDASLLSLVGIFSLPVFGLTILVGAIIAPVVAGVVPITFGKLVSTLRDPRGTNIAAEERQRLLLLSFGLAALTAGLPFILGGLDFVSLLNLWPLAVVVVAGYVAAKTSNRSLGYAFYGALGFMISNIIIGAVVVPAALR